MTRPAKDEYWPNLANLSAQGQKLAIRIDRENNQVVVSIPQEGTRLVKRVIGRRVYVEEVPDPSSPVIQEFRFGIGQWMRLMSWSRRQLEEHERDSNSPSRDESLQEEAGDDPD